MTPRECLVIEDSDAGIKAALDEGTRCIAVPTSFTRKNVAVTKFLEQRWVVNEPREILKTVQLKINE